MSWCLIIEKTFLILRCNGEFPNEVERPFSIAGPIASRREADGADFNSFMADIGEWSVELEEQAQIDPAMFDRSVEYDEPPREVILYVVDYLFPRCDVVPSL